MKMLKQVFVIVLAMALFSSPVLAADTPQGAATSSAETVATEGTLGAVGGGISTKALLIGAAVTAVVVGGVAAASSSGGGGGSSTPATGH